MGQVETKVDVLAVLDECIKSQNDALANWSHEYLHEARAAVAELIEAATEVRAAHRELPSMDHPGEVRQEGEARIGRAHYALESALARVSGGEA